MCCLPIIVLPVTNILLPVILRDTLILYTQLNNGHRVGTLNNGHRIETVNNGHRVGTLNNGHRVGTLNNGHRHY